MKRARGVMCILLVSCVLAAAGCGRRDEGLKIVIEEKTSPGSEPLRGAPTPAVETLGPETRPESIPGRPGTTTMEKPETGPALTLPITSVVSLVENDPDVAKLLAAIPAWMVVVARPTDSHWGVRLSFKEAALFDLRVDDGSKTILEKKPHLIGIKKVKDGLEKRVGRVYRETMGRPVVPFSASVKAALAADGVRALDYTKEFLVSVGNDRAEGNPKGEVVIDYGDGGPVVHVTLDGRTGEVTGVREEAKVQ